MSTRYRKPKKVPPKPTMKEKVLAFISDALIILLFVGIIGFFGSAAAIILSFGQFAWWPSIITWQKLLVAMGSCLAMITFIVFYASWVLSDQPVEQ